MARVGMLGAVTLIVGAALAPAPFTRAAGGPVLGIGTAARPAMPPSTLSSPTISPSSTARLHRAGPAGHERRRARSGAATTKRHGHRMPPVRASSMQHPSRRVHSRGRRHGIRRHIPRPRPRLRGRRPPAVRDSTQAPRKLDGSRLPTAITVRYLPRTAEDGGIRSDRSNRGCRRQPERPIEKLRSA